MEKFSLFDLLALAVPGSMALVLAYWGFTNTVPAHLAAPPLPDAVAAVVMLMLAYFVGHLVNDAGMWLEARLGGLPKSWVDVLQADTDLARRLNTVAQKVFDLSFLNPDGTVDVPRSGQFYDHAFNALEVGGKLDKVRALQAQYVFLRNTVVLGLWGILVFGSVFVVQVWSGQAWNATVPGISLVAAGLCGMTMPLARRLSIKRRKMKMSATLQNFYAYYILENQFKK